MKFKTTNDDGEEIEVEAATQEELNAKLAEQKTALEDAHKKELEEKEGTLSTLAQEKKDLEEKISKLGGEGKGDDHPNFKILKEALDKKDEAINKIKGEFDADKKQRVTEEMESFIKIVSKGNEELEKKIKFHLEKTLTGLSEGTKAERKTKIEAAYKLAADVSSDGPSMFDSGTGGGGRGGEQTGGSSGGVEFSSKEKALGAKLGLTDADYKKYGSRVSKR